MKDNKPHNNNIFKNGHYGFASNFLFLRIKIIAILIVIAVVIIAIFCFLNRNNEITINNDSRTTLSPTDIRSIKDIGEWEFLSISDEELTDTVRHGFFGDDELIRIYYGTLRLGIDMHEVGKDWITTDNDTIICTLPKVKLLDNKFINEAKTKSFFESGTWSSVDRESLYNKAYKEMLKRCMTADNIKKAEENAHEQFINLLSSMGYDKIKVTFADTNTKK